MQIKQIKINNITSFLNFQNDIDFEKKNLIFGTNGAGKSTLISMLQHIDSFKEEDSEFSEINLKEFLKKRLSKESLNGVIDIEILFNSKNEKISYDQNSDILKCSNKIWPPIRIFNDDYTNRNIGDNIEINLEDGGLLIGEINKDLESAEKKKKSLDIQINNIEKEVRNLITGTVDEFRNTTDSKLNVDSILSIENFLNLSCEYIMKNDLIKQRKKLGFGKPDKKVYIFDENQYILSMDFKNVEEKLSEKVFSPKIEDDIALVLINYTDFFKAGVSIYEKSGEKKCPFCRQIWADAEEKVNEYKSFLQSEYNKKRNKIKSFKDDLGSYKVKINEQKRIINEIKTEVDKESLKYNIDASSWQTLSFSDTMYNELIEIFDDKYINMNKSFSISEKLKQLEKYHLSIIQNNNKIIQKIEESIDSIIGKRKNLNNLIAQHFMRKIWMSFETKRSEYYKLKKELNEIETKINELEKENQAQDTIQAVFNELLKFIGLDEYYLDANKKLHLKLEKDYDISSEGKRISTSQRKILSLCYYFSEIVSSVKDVTELKKYILVFDDPVDSADYIFFHSITTVIEKCEKLLSIILKKEKLKFGQFFVFTHNALLYDRLTCNWSDYHKSLIKEKNRTKIVKANKKINNYAIYIDEVIKYYKNPKSDRRRMTYIGNIIRRILEILSSFDNLGKNDFQNILDGMGKSKLALLANHMSHDSFTKVLNPLQDNDELKQACQEVLEIIKENHPSQFNTIEKEYELGAL